MNTFKPWFFAVGLSIVGCGLLTPPVQAQGLFLHVVEVSAPDGHPTIDAPWLVALSMNDPEAARARLPEALEAWQPMTADGVAQDLEDRLWLQVTDGQVLGGPVTARHRKASFLIDFHEPSVVALVDALWDSLEGPELAQRPGIDRLTEFVHSQIPDKTHGRGWDLASRVAEYGEGDCTEHAVLLAAVARALGYPARVVVGLALGVPVDGTLDPVAMGHAWTEIHDGERWRVVDATQVADDARYTLRLLPTGEVDNEGPGYARSILASLVLMPKHVEFRPSIGP